MDMSDFDIAFERTLLAEGGYKLTNDPTDRGGQTYAGIARKANPDWPGWASIDAGGAPPADMVRSVYRAKYWTPLALDEVTDQRIASSIYDFAVNAGPSTSAKLAQLVVGATPDGKIGPKTVMALNAIDPDLFVAHFALAKVGRYVGIVKRDRSQVKFLVGWLNRTLEAI
jgi:lysozyme family protein